MEETPEEFWRRLIEIEKECSFSTISAEELLISKYMTAITNENLRDKMMKKNTRIEYYFPHFSQMFTSDGREGKKSETFHKCPSS